jgi:RHH-type rel operon transcriptional repressor/antitoxin RelB
LCLTAAIQLQNLYFKKYTCTAKQKTRMLALRLPEDIESRLDKLAKATGRTKSFYAREAILEHLADLEDLYLAEKRLAKVRNGKSKTYSLNAVEQALGLAN